jgi:putative addiction module component (TIGR02574 family)
MSAHFQDLAMQVTALPVEEKAALARLLIEQLDPSVDANVEQLWIDEAQRRYDAYQKGELDSRPGDEAMARARNRLK